MRSVETMCFFTVLFLCQPVFGGLGVIKYYPDDQGKINTNSHCFSSSQSIGELNLGEIKQLEGCGYVRCMENRDILYYTCAHTDAVEDCQVLPGDPSKPYPECCYTMKCLKDNDGNFLI